jgi:2-polyprenyl-3-methyl-5-hydroxy-6-metoxy-1,4-benzoquinol methylase
VARDFHRRFEGWDFILQSCDSCGAITQRYAPDQAFASELYGKWIDKDPGREHKKAPPLQEYMHQIQEALILTTFLLKHRRKAVPSDLKVLDYGTGWGRFALAMKATGCDVYALDL